MIERFTQGKLVWMNLKNPTTEEVGSAMKELGISPILMTDLTTVVPKNTAIRSDGTIKITLDFPTIKRLEPNKQFEVKFLISKNSLLTVQYEEMEGIDRFKRQFEVTATLKRAQKHHTGGHLFFSLFGNLYESAASKLDYIESKLSDIEAEIFKNNEKHMVFEISMISKKLIAFRHVVHSHDDVFRDLAPLFEHVFGASLNQDLATIQRQYFVLKRRADAQYETLVALRETNTAMLNTKQNEIMKLFTIMAFTTFPLTLFSSMFGMNTEATPIVGHPADFWIIVSIMVTAMIGFFTFFKHKHWM